MAFRYGIPLILPLAGDSHSNRWALYA
jgi:hypothetical protein